ncbi:hypothetical protein D3C87_1408790 [compost metagenome]
MRGEGIGATLTPSVDSMVLTVHGGTRREICASPVRTWVARVSASGTKLTRPPESFGMPPQ